jgi:predicted RNase H-like HicB family nuclease
VGVQLWSRFVAMANDRVARSKNGRRHPRAYDFTVVLTPVSHELRPTVRDGKTVRRMKNPPGYQVTVPLLPGIVTYGRDRREALAMARDAIRCHIDGLRKSGEEIPDESVSRTAKLRVALSA